MGRLSVSVGAPHELFAVSRKHWKAIESWRRCDLLKTSAIYVDHEDLELSPLRVAIVGAEDDVLIIRREKGSERRATQVCDLLLVAAISVHHPDLELARSDQVLF